MAIQQLQRAAEIIDLDGLLRQVQVGGISLAAAGQFLNFGGAPKFRFPGLGLLSLEALRFLAGACGPSPGTSSRSNRDHRGAGLRAWKSPLSGVWPWS